MLRENTKTSGKRGERTRVYGQFCVESEADLNANSQTHSYKKQSVRLLLASTVSIEQSQEGYFPLFSVFIAKLAGC